MNTQNSDPFGQIKKAEEESKKKIEEAERKFKEELEEKIIEFEKNSEEKADATRKKEVSKLEETKKEAGISVKKELSEALKQNEHIMDTANNNISNSIKEGVTIFKQLISS